MAQASIELLNRITGGGLSVSYRFTRTISIFSPRMISIELTFTNNGEKAMDVIKIGEKVSKYLLLYIIISIIHFFNLFQIIREG